MNAWLFLLHIYNRVGQMTLKPGRRDGLPHLNVNMCST
ncbi:uncharacterized protein METZ01_LOCUS405398 [marine metagenome]|uniref:Uncharacterized protein n=1 Tax=marine metagenome TaxID=408172 RepID=A0A382W1I4_9ZZZZ